MKIETIEIIARRTIADEKNRKKLYDEWIDKNGFKKIQADDDNHSSWVNGVKSLLDNIIKEEPYYEDPADRDDRLYHEGVDDEAMNRAKENK